MKGRPAVAKVVVVVAADAKAAAKAAAKTAAKAAAATPLHYFIKPSLPQLPPPLPTLQQTNASALHQHCFISAPLKQKKTKKAVQDSTNLKL